MKTYKEYRYYYFKNLNRWREPVFSDQLIDSEQEFSKWLFEGQAKEIERLKKEKEWLIKLLYKEICATPITIDAYRRSLDGMMQQALKDK